jgi:protein SCO1
VLSRAQLVLLVVAVMALGGAIAATLAARSDNGDDGAAAQVTELDGVRGAKTQFKGAIRPEAPPRDFTLRDQDGDMVSLRALRGYVVVLAPMYTACQESCPLVAQQIRDVLGELPDGEREQVKALALSVDPARDSADSARSFLLEQRVRGYMDYLVGSRDELRPVWRVYGFSPQTESVEHNSWVVLIDRRGRQRVGFPIDYLTPEALRHDVRQLLRERS